MLLRSALPHTATMWLSSALHFCASWELLPGIQHTQRHCALSAYPLHSPSLIFVWSWTETCWSHTTFWLASSKILHLWCTSNTACISALLQWVSHPLMSGVLPDLWQLERYLDAYIACDTSTSQCQTSKLSGLHCQEPSHPQLIFQNSSWIAGMLKHFFPSLNSLL